MEYYEMIEVIQAHKEGKKIEYRKKGAGDTWRLIARCVWNFYEYDYRIAPKPEPPKYRPWKYNELPKVGTVLIQPSTYDERMVVRRTLEYVYLGDAENAWSPEDLLAQWQQLDGSPCGVKE